MTGCSSSPFVLCLPKPCARSIEILSMLSCTSGCLLERSKAVIQSWHWIHFFLLECHEILNCFSNCGFLIKLLVPCQSSHFLSSCSHLSPELRIGLCLSVNSFSQSFNGPMNKRKAFFGDQYLLSPTAFAVLLCLSISATVVRTRLSL